MKHSPWESGIRSAGQKVPHPLWNPKVQYRVQHSPLLDSVLSQMNTLHILTQYLRSILILSP